MTACAGDALSHVYFSWPPGQFSDAIFKAISTRPFAANQGLRFRLPQVRPEGRASRKPNGSARICMGAMNLRNRPNPVPRRLLVATSRTLTNTLFISNSE